MTDSEHAIRAQSKFSAIALAIVLLLCSPIVVSLACALDVHYNRYAGDARFVGALLWSLVAYTVGIAAFIAIVAPFHPDRNWTHVLLMWLAIAFTAASLYFLEAFKLLSW